MKTPIENLIGFALNRENTALFESPPAFSREDAWFLASRILNWLRESGKPAERRRAGWKSDAPVSSDMAAFISAVQLDSVLEIRNNAIAFAQGLSEADRDALLTTVASNYRPQIWIN